MTSVSGRTTPGNQSRDNRPMSTGEGIDVPALGRFAKVPVAKKPAKLIFHGVDEFNKQF